MQRTAFLTVPEGGAFNASPGCLLWVVSHDDGRLRCRGISHLHLSCTALQHYEQCNYTECFAPTSCCFRRSMPSLSATSAREGPPSKLHA